MGRLGGKVGRSIGRHCGCEIIVSLQVSSLEMVIVSAMINVVVLRSIAARQMAAIYAGVDGDERPQRALAPQQTCGLSDVVPPLDFFRCH